MRKEDKMKTNVIVKLQVEGTHYWDGCNIAEVNYLANEHRHIFHITAKKEVKHGDRDIEIIKMKHDIEMHFMQYFSHDKRLYRFGGQSCEMLASGLVEQFDLCYCSVLEDNENGAEVFGSKKAQTGTAFDDFAECFAGIVGVACQK